jgi:Zn-dependent protease
MGPPEPGKPDASAFLSLVGDYRIGVYGGVEIIRARLLPGVSGSDPAVLAALESWGGQAFVDTEVSEPEVVLVRPIAQKREPWLLYVATFLLTLFTTMAAGAFQQDLDPVGLRPFTSWEIALPTGVNLRALWAGAIFALPFMGILLCHEFGHYFAAKRHKIPVTPPCFIPFPPWYSIVGTLGAFIRIKGPTVRRSELLDVAVWGPIASFFLSIPVLLIGLWLSQPAIGPTPALTPFVVRFGYTNVWLGDGPLLHLLGMLVFPGQFGLGPIVLHPLAFVGWLGLFVTALNLMPLGQLDGGHILYCLWTQPGQERAARVFVLLLIPLGWYWWGWWLWGGGALLVNRGRLAHPPVLLPNAPLDARRRLVARLAILAFLLTFVPVPVSL